MGGFHCPLGAMSPGNEGCIRCGLCSAASKADYAKAADILRAYIREHAPRPGRAEKIAVCGKGGRQRMEDAHVAAAPAARARHKDRRVPTQNRRMEDVEGNRALQHEIANGGWGSHCLRNLTRAASAREIHYCRMR